MNFTYEEHVRPYADTFSSVYISESLILKAEDWASRMIEEKMKEEQWKRDHSRAKKRLVTGLVGEMAIEIYLGIDFIDWSIGSSQFYAVPDMSSYGLNVGIKTVEHGKFPLIKRRNPYPQIINVWRKNDGCCFICGVATPDVLVQYQSDSLVLSKDVLRKGNKTGFYGFEYLNKFSSVDDLRLLK